MKGVTSKATAGGGGSGASKGPKKESASSANAPDRGSSGFRPRDERQEQLERDHELFLQAFEKPTQIYRYLRTRTMISPVFLHRTLTYMRSRQSPRNNTARLRGFKIDTLLERKLKETSDNMELMKPYMTLTFLGFYEKKRDKPLERVNLELILVKVTSTNKKRSKSEEVMSNHSNSNSSVVHVPLGCCEVPVNPSEEHPPNKAPALSVPSDSFSLAAHHNYKAFSIYVKVTPPTSNQQHQTVSNGVSDCTNGSSGSDSNSATTPMLLSPATAGSVPSDPAGSTTDENQEPSSKRRKMDAVKTSKAEDTFSRLVSREMDIYDKNSRCLMSEGEYELLLSEDLTIPNGDLPNKRNGSWENSNSGGGGSLDAFISAPTLKFRLSWSNETAGSLVERPRPLMPRENSQDLGSLRRNSTTNGGDGKSVCKPSIVNGTARSNGKSGGFESSKQPGILYQFLYNNNSRQQTEARDDLHCPWCSLNCVELYPLLKHLKLSHPRFLFTYLPIQEGARIDVSVSELFDSTYVGNPNDLISQQTMGVPGYAFSRHGPVQRTPITNIIVCKPKRQPPSLSEFLEIEENDINCPYDGQRPFVTGHNRLYHYSTTNLPMPPCAILTPSTEDQVDPPWLMTKICRMIDEFSDVNEGEKEFMKMWNLHVQHYTFVGDCQMGLALKMFIEEKGQELLDKRLYWNFVLHLCNMFEFGVLSPGHVFTAISRLQQFIKESGLAGELSYWNINLEQALAAKNFTSPSRPPRPPPPAEQPSAAAASTSQQQRKDFSGIFKSEPSSSSSQQHDQLKGKSNDDLQGVDNPSSSSSQKGVVENKVDSNTSDKTGQQLKSTTSIATTEQQPPKLSKLCKDAAVTPAAATTTTTATATPAKSQESPSRPAF